MNRGGATMMVTLLSNLMLNSPCRERIVYLKIYVKAWPTKTLINPEEFRVRVKSHESPVGELAEREQEVARRPAGTVAKSFT
jgi:hypothetical protein